MTTPVEPIKTTIIGLGRAGWSIHWQLLLKEHPAFKVVGAVESVAERRAEAEAEMGCCTYSSLEKFLSDPVGELVVITTPSGGHADEAMACLDANLHVVVDKPMCQSVAEVDAMIGMAHERRRLLTCYHPYRFNPCFKAIAAILSSGRLGRIVTIKSTRSGFVRRNDWVMRKARGGGIHNVWGSHSVDQCLQLAGSAPRDIFSDLQCTVTPGDADDHCKILIRCDNGVVIDVEVSNCMAQVLQPEWQIAGTCGGLVSTAEGLHIRWFDPEATPTLRLQDGPAVGRRYDTDDTLPWQEEHVSLPGMSHPVDFYTNVAAVIREGAETLVTPESVCETIQVLEACRRQNPGVSIGGQTRMALT